MIHYRAHHGPSSSHQQIARLVREMNVGPVLDVGSAQGTLGQLLAGSGLEIDAVEPNPAWAETARPHYRNVFTGTIESVALPEAHYNVVVCADVLEHTTNPAEVIEQLKTHATDDAIFIISLPNVAHLSVRLMLLLGHFPKMQRGILDRTHLHFFTRKTAAQMLCDAGLRIDRTLTTVVPLEELAQAAGTKRALMSVSRIQEPLAWLLPRMFAFQWIFISRRRTRAVPRSG